MYLIANWKQNLTYADLDSWVAEFNSELESIPDNLKVIIAPPYPFLFPLNERIKGAFRGRIKIASQNISASQSGAHTGEVGADQLKNLVSYSIVGHSERRAMGETTEDLNKKIGMALEADIMPIVCFSNAEEYKKIKVPAKRDILYAYEPLDAIGSKNPASPEKIAEFLKSIKLKSVIYGGSVDKNSIGNYLKMDSISGFLVGSASLNPVEFGDLVNILL